MPSIHPRQPVPHTLWTVCPSHTPACLSLPLSPVYLHGPNPRISHYLPVFPLFFHTFRPHLACPRLLVPFPDLHASCPHLSHPTQASRGSWGWGWQGTAGPDSFSPSYPAPRRHLPGPVAGWEAPRLRGAPECALPSGGAAALAPPHLPGLGPQRPPDAAPAPAPARRRRRQPGLRLPGRLRAGRAWGC